MLKDIPYEMLKRDKRAYEILLLRDQYDNSFSDIAAVYGISATRAAQIYNRLKGKQIRFYIRHIAFALGYESTEPVRNIFWEAYEWYQDYPSACAYLEQNYTRILTTYRGGEPGMPPSFLNRLPPFQPCVSEQTTARVIELREEKQASFAAIARELHMTQAKARQIYHSFYHAQTLELVQALQDKAGSPAEKKAVWDACFRNNLTPKKRYEMLTKT